MRFFIYIFFIGFFSVSNGQGTLNELLKEYNSETIPYISVDSLQEIIQNSKEKIILLDARELKEYRISKIQNAIHIGYNDFNIHKITEQIPSKNTKIIVYCSLGIRSEDIAEQLYNKGFINIFNLFGGIFEWKNKGYQVVDIKNKKTEKVHAFSKEWSVWLKKGTKIYD